MIFGIIKEALYTKGLDKERELYSEKPLDLGMEFKLASKQDVEKSLHVLGFTDVVVDFENGTFTPTSSLDGTVISDKNILEYTFEEVYA